MARLEVTTIDKTGLNYLRALTAETCEAPWDTWQGKGWLFYNKRPGLLQMTTITEYQGLSG